MKKLMKKVIIWFSLSVCLLVFWIVGMILGNMLFPSSIMSEQAESDNTGLLIMFLITLLNSGVVLQLIGNSRLKSWKLFWTLFIVCFGLQFFMTQIETFWFNDSLQLPINFIWAILIGGALTSWAFCVMAILFTRNYKSPSPAQQHFVIDVNATLKRIAVLSIILWPLIYFTFGYFIAWQFTEVRVLYSDSSKMGGFMPIMIENLNSGLYLFQILRGLLWIGIALIIMQALEGSKIKKGLIVGSIFTILSSSQLLLANPFMSETVRMAHLIETGSENFLWGFLIVWFLGNFIGIRNRPDNHFEEESNKLKIRITNSSA